MLFSTLAVVIVVAVITPIFMAAIIPIAIFYVVFVVSFFVSKNTYSFELQCACIMLLENNAILVDMIDRNVLMFLAAILSNTYSELMVLINQLINQSIIKAAS